MERFNRTNPAQDSRASSVYSNNSVKRHTYSEYADSMTSTSSRPISFTPSYGVTVPPRKPVGSKRAPSELKGVFTAPSEPVELPTARSPPSPPLPILKGMLVVAIAATPHPSTISYLQMMLKRGSYSGIIIIGSAEHETELKQLKMNIYGLLGKMGLEVAVQVEFKDAWSESEISAVVSRIVGNDELVNGVLCSPSYDGTRSLDSNILTLDESQLALPWACSVGFLHNLARSILPKVRSNMDIRGNVARFLVTEPTETTAISYFYEAACENLVTQLAETSGNSGLTIAYAQDVLVAEPEPSDTNDNLNIPIHGGPLDNDSADSAPDSPTKLWGMWALQDQLEEVD